MKQKLNIFYIGNSVKDVHSIEQALIKSKFIIIIIRIKDQGALQKALQSGKPDFVFADFKFPGFSGTSAVKVVHEHHPFVPCIMISGTGGEKNAVESIKAGACDFVVKKNLSRILPVFERELNSINSEKTGELNASPLDNKDEEIKRLRSSEERFRLMSDKLNDLIWIVDSELKITYISPSVCQILGFNCEDKRLHDLRIFVTPESLNRIRLILEPGMSNESGKLIDDAPPVSFDIHYYHKNGYIVSMESEVSIIHDKEGSITGLNGLSRATSYRHLAERSMEMAAEILEIMNTRDEHIRLIEKIIQMLKVSSGFDNITVRLKRGEEYPAALTDGSFGNISNTGANPTSPYSEMDFAKGHNEEDILDWLCGKLINKNNNEPLCSEGGSFHTGSINDLLKYKSTVKYSGILLGYCKAHSIESFALVPVKSAEETIGILQINDHRSDRFAKEKILFFEKIASAIGIAIKKLRDKEENTINKKRFESLLKIAQYKTTSAGELIDIGLKEAIRRSGSKAGYIYNYNEDLELFTLSAWLQNNNDLRSEKGPPLSYRLENSGYWSDAIEQRKSIIDNDFERHDPLKKGFAHEYCKLSRLMIVPVIINMQIVAVVGLGNKPENYTENDACEVTQLMEMLWNLTEQKKAEILLRENEEKFRGIYENSADSIVLADEEGRIIGWNEASNEIFGIENEKAIGKYLWEVRYEMSTQDSRTPENYELLKKEILNICNKGIEKKSDAFYESEFIHPSGTIKSIQTRLFSVLTEKGYLAVCITRDISELKKSREEEKKQLYDLELLSETAMDFVKMKYNENIHAFIGEKLKEITGASIVVINKYDPASKNVQVNDIIGLNSSITQKLKNLMGDDLHKLCYKLSANDFHFLVSGKLILLKSGFKKFLNKKTYNIAAGQLKSINSKPIYTIGLTDKEELMGSVLIIDPQKSFNKLVAETFINQASVALINKITVNALRQSETRFNSLFEKNNDIIFTLDSKEQITSINPIGKKLITGKREKNVKIKTYLTSDSYNRFKKMLADCSSKEAKYCAEEMELYALNGDLLTFQVSFLITYAEQKIKEIFGIARNTTKDKMLQNQILSKIIETEEREKKAFSEELHDGLGSLISTMNIYIGMLMKKDKSPKQKEGYLNQLRQLAHEAVANVRLFSNSLTPNVLNNFGLAVAIKLFGEKINTSRPGHINIQAPVHFPRFDRIIEINLYRIVIELINNSLKYSKSTSIHIDLSCKGKNIILHYHDDGRGFDMNKVLESATAGSGIKNIIARVKSLNGVFDFKSQENKGIDYHFTIPKTTAIKTIN